MTIAAQVGASGPYHPHGVCYLWESDLLWTHAISDGLIALAYYSIPLALLYFIRRRDVVPFKGMFVAFAVFILACGTTHLMAVWTLWFPDYWASAAVKVVTAGASVATAVLLVPFVPKAVAVPTPRELEEQNRLLEQRMREREEARQELEEQNRLLNAVLGSLGEGVVVSDTEGRITHWNEEATRILGRGPTDVPPGELVEEYGVFLPDRVTPYPTEELPLLKAIRGESVDADEQFVRHETRPDGVWVTVTGRPVKSADGEVMGGVVVFRDMTERKKNEAAIRALNEDLAERLEELERKNRELDTFAYSVSHDLRAPLRAMEGFSRALLEDYGDALEETGRDYAERIVASSDRMSELIEDLLAYSRLSRADLARRPVALDEVAEDAIEQQRAAIEESGAEVQVVGDLGRVQAHRRTLVQMVANLVANAVTYVDDGVRPVVRLGTESAGDGRVRLWVEDEGIGIEAEHQERVFEVFERLHSRERYAGTGIGLAIVAKGAERMGGTVGVESEPGEGSRFWIELEEAGS